MATIQDIADAVGISKAAVSRILNHKGSFSKETIARVEQAARKLNYVPTGYGRSEQAENMKLLAAVFPTGISPYYGILSVLLEQFAYDYGYQLMLCGSLYDYEKEEECFANLQEKRISGIILGCTTQNAEAIRDNSLPVVSVGFEVCPEVPSVQADNYASGRIAALHLAGRGCRDCLYLTGSHFDLEQDARWRGFKDTLSGRNITVSPYHITVDQKLAGAIPDVITNMLLEHPDADGLFAESQRLAVESIEVCKTLGIDVPARMKIVGFGNPYLLPYSSPRITLVKENTREIARHTIEKLVYMIEHPADKPPASMVIPVALDQNETT